MPSGVQSARRGAALHPRRLHHRLDRARRPRGDRLDTEPLAGAHRDRRPGRPRSGYRGTARGPSDLADPPSDDICYASTNRQAAVQAIAARCDLVLVVGSSSSSNSRRLVEVAHAAGAAHAFLIDDADGVDAGWLAGVHTVGLSAGASTPETLVDEVLSSLADHGYADVVLATVTIEDVRFELPRELRA
ncbi:hypothetical protein [Tamaricihabitans halophyticus]|uniref:hypothetical protein n=1 Tax=Tamaricihabitans halophyticus TaxID=1262583 RepID=UPI001A9DAE26